MNANLMPNVKSAVLADIEVAAPQASKFLMYSRQVDCLMIGGLSIVFWVLLYVFDSKINLIITDLGALVTMFSTVAHIFVNHNHFLASYKLAYSQGSSFVRQNHFQLVVVPLLLLLLTLLVWRLWQAPLSKSFFNELNGFFSLVGFHPRLGKHESVGQELLAFLVTFMHMTVGWHYAKQSFGCVMVYSKYDNYAFTDFQKRLLKYMLLSTWWVSFLSFNTTNKSYNYLGLKIFRLGLPAYLSTIFQVIFFLLLAGSIAIFIFNYRTKQQAPSINILTPLVALMLWHLPLAYHSQFILLLPVFHSLQYVPFVYKIERVHLQKRTATSYYKELRKIFLLLTGAGLLVFYVVPLTLDHAVGNLDLFGVSACLIVVHVFINIHHYFIDNVLWRFKNNKVQLLF